MLLLVNSETDELNFLNYLKRCCCKLKSFAPQHFRQISIDDLETTNNLEGCYFMAMVQEVIDPQKCNERKFVLGEFNEDDVSRGRIDKVITLEPSHEIAILSRCIKIDDLVLLFNFQVDVLHQAKKRWRNMINLAIVTSPQTKLIFMPVTAARKEEMGAFQQIHVDKLSCYLLNLELNWFNFEGKSDVKEIIFDNCTSNYLKALSKNKRKKSMPDVQRQKIRERIKERHIKKLQKQNVQEDAENTIVEFRSGTFDVDKMQIFRLQNLIHDFNSIREHLERSSCKQTELISNRQVNARKEKQLTLDAVEPGIYFDLECQVIAVAISEDGEFQTHIKVWDGTKISTPAYNKFRNCNLRFFDNELIHFTDYVVSINVFGSHVKRLLQLKMHQLIRIRNVHSRIVTRFLVLDLYDGGSAFGRGISEMKVGTDWNHKFEHRLKQAKSELLSKVTNSHNQTKSDKHDSLGEKLLATQNNINGKGLIINTCNTDNILKKRLAESMDIYKLNLEATFKKSFAKVDEEEKNDKKGNTGSC